MFKRILLSFTSIILLAAFLRLYALAVVPPAPSLDEVSIGYNAYAILQTGKDEYGYRLPLLLRAYDDWRPAFYVYLVIPFVHFMGLTILAVRFPSIVLSLISVYLVYRIGKLFSKYDPRLLYLGEVSSLLLAISPWHIYISRLGHESNVGLTLTIAGMYALFLFIVEKKSWQLVWAGVWFGLSLHGYQSQKLIIPIVGITTAILYWKECLKESKKLVIALTLFLLIAIPAVYVTLTGSGLERLKGTSAFSSDAPVYQEAFQAAQISQNNGDALGKIINNRKVVMARVFMKNYFSHFSVAWLFMGSNREAHKVPFMGLLYPWELLGIVVGLVYMLVFSRIDIRALLLLLVWGLSSPLPAAITTQAPHAMRSYTLLPVLALIGGVGWLEIWHVLKKPLHYGRWVIVFFIMSWSVLQFWHNYYVVFPKTQSDAFQYAVKDAVSFALQKSDAYKRIEVSNSGNLYQSYMFYLYYTKLDPTLYLTLGATVSGGFQESHTIGKFAFGILPQNVQQLSKETLYFYDAKIVPNGVKTIKTFVNLDGEVAIVAVSL